MKKIKGDAKLRHVTLINLNLSCDDTIFKHKMVHKAESNKTLSLKLLKVNNRNTRARCEICSKLTVKTPQQTPLAPFWCLHCYFPTYFTPCSSASVVNFEQVNAG